MAGMEVIPGIGVCKTCDASVMGAGAYGEVIAGDQCGGCGLPTYQLLVPRLPSDEELRAMQSRGELPSDEELARKYP
jgi:hypothetical protein